MSTQFFASCFILQIWYNNSVRKIRGKNMKKLNNLQKEMIMKQFPKLANLVIKYVEKIGNEKTDLQDDIQLAYDFIQEKQ
jgi:hypothetical protein